MSRRSSGYLEYQIGLPLLSKMTLNGSPPPPRLSIKIGSGSGLLLVVITIHGKSLGTETPFDMMPATPGEATRVCILGGGLPVGFGVATTVEATAYWGAESAQCPADMN